PPAVTATGVAPAASGAPAWKRGAWAPVGSRWTVVYGRTASGPVVYRPASSAVAPATGAPVTAASITDQAPGTGAPVDASVTVPVAAPRRGAMVPTRSAGAPASTVTVVGAPANPERWSPVIPRRYTR